ncbi:hypothetical protein ILUMI_15580 [Ignelater luminosus]|uniref:Uncharacterized protein n=1 Tax=Ignelater luminosus TaxID=2038154 RepID=A0A8K0G9S5_IGNLU|nr:hypothetical protein ILUMI_15580 [Ignelater luminosus]
MPSISFNNPNQNQFFSTPINFQNRTFQNKFPSNPQTLDKKSEPKPTPMSIVSNKTIPRPNQSAIRRPTNCFQSTGPRNFISEELYNVETPQEYQSEFEENYDDFTQNQEYEEDR